MFSKRSILGTMLLAVALLAWAPVAHAMVMETVLVGNPGNAADDTGYGAVDYEYNIGKYEVTNTQYMEFLNAVATVGDPHALYSPNMSATWRNVGGIARAGSGTEADPYAYSTITGMAEHPVSSVTFWDTCRFANWLTNDQGGPATTEYGTYTLDGVTNPPNADVTRNPDSLWAVTSEDEWYKAAYYDPNKAGGAGYWDYPTGSDTQPISELPPGGENSANRMWGGDDTNCYTDVGAYTDSAGPYGTFDQGGNAQEWNDTIDGVLRGVRGGSFHDGADYLHAADRYNHEPTYEDRNDIGFRVVSVILVTPLLWDADTGITDAQDGDGDKAWSHGGGNWWDGEDNVNVAWDNDIKTVATFGAGDATADPTVTVDTVTASGIVFSGAGGHKYTLTGGTITLAGSATIEANVDARIESAIDAGTAVLTKTGPGTLELTGANTYSGVAVDGGTLVGYTGVGDTGSILGDVDLSGGSNVTFNQGADGVYDGKISGDGSFTKTGAGTLVVTSKEHDYTGDATVSDGTLRVTGYLPYSTVTVEDGGTLGGGDGGRVGPIDLLQGGTLAPGASVGTLIADGDVTFGNGGNKLVAELLGADADRVTVNGDLTLGDATALELVFGGANPFQADTYTLASYDTLVGTFSSVTSLGDYSTGVAYGANAITITLDASLLPGDATLDRTVNLNDFARLRNNFGTGDTWAEADFNGDDTVNLNDFAILRNNFGSHVPEPATLALLGLGGLVTLIRRRR